MAYETLADFFDTYHHCNNRTLWRAVVRCAQRSYGDSLRKAAMSWQPDSHIFQKFRQDIFKPPKLTKDVISPEVTRVRKELEAWLNEHGYPRPKPPSLPVKTLWDIFNAVDRYSPEEIKGGIWMVMHGNYGYDDSWKPILQQHIRWHTPTSEWEQELTKLILTKYRTPSPRDSTTPMFNIARRTIAWLRRHPLEELHHGR